jgi:phage FluMu gp28-like protein
MKGLIPFRLYPFQADLLETLIDHRFNIILKARQLGISTITAAYVAWMMMFHKEKNVLVIATKFNTAANLVKKVKAIIKNMPPWLRISEVSIDNRTSFVLSNGSQIKASSTSGDAGRSEALSLLVIDEAAHVEGLDELWTGLYPTLSTGGRCIALSTPNGVGNWFHKSYSESECLQ